MKRSRIYFASDFHLGIPTIHDSHNRERLIISWLEQIQKDAASIYLIGDIFDFWFEYKKVVPKGFVRILGKLAELTDMGINIYFISGNHDMWVKDYLKNEIGIEISHGNSIIHEQNIKIFIGHGDGLGNGDYLYKFLRSIFTSKVCRWMFARLHPNFAFTIAHAWSNSRNKYGEPYIKDQKEIILQYCKNHQKKNPVDYYILGHRHMPLEISVDKRATYINTGDWISHNTYAVLEKGSIKLRSYKKS